MSLRWDSKSRLRSKLQFVLKKLQLVSMQRSLKTYNHQNSNIQYPTIFYDLPFLSYEHNIFMTVLIHICKLITTQEQGIQLSTRLKNFFLYNFIFISEIIQRIYNLKLKLMPPRTELSFFFIYSRGPNVTFGQPQ